jgi:hypothetical protein
MRTVVASLSPGNDFLCTFGHSNHDIWNLRGNTSDLSNSCKTTWESLVKQDDIRDYWQCLE